MDLAEHICDLARALIEHVVKLNNTTNVDLLYLLKNHKNIFNIYFYELHLMKEDKYARVAFEHDGKACGDIEKGSLDGIPTLCRGALKVGKVKETLRF